MKAMQSKQWANFLNEWSEDRFIPWTDCCPYCKEPSWIEWHGWKQKERPGAEIEINVWSCVNCEAVLNFDEDDPKANVLWLTEAEAQKRGLKIGAGGITG